MKPGFKISLIVLALSMLGSGQHHRRGGTSLPEPPKSGPFVLPLSKSDWQGFCQGGNPCARNFLSNNSAVLEFAFPVYNDPKPCNVDDCPSVNYLFAPAGSGWPQRSPLVITGYSTIQATFQITVTGNPVFFYQTDLDNTCVFPASVRLFFWQWGGSATGEDRWWSNPVSYQLAPGAGTLSVPLTPDQWSDVAGQIGTEDPQGFAGALNNINFVGLTFGGGCFFGHGVSVSGGTAEFYLTGYSLQ